MRADRWIRKLLPREDRFLALFVEDVENLAQAAGALRDLLAAPDDAERGRLAQRIEDLEHRGDEITHTIFRELSLTFITPLDREDIGTLATALDNIVDLIDRSATCTRLYDISTFGDAERDLAAIIEKAAAELKVAIPLLHDLRNADRIKEACVRVNAYENQADEICHRALGRLFREEKDPIRLIKTRELLAMLEAATDRCEDAAVLLETVLVKQA